MLTRYPDWPGRLEVFLRANSKRKFRYGDWDCCLFVADAIEAMTGTDLATDFRWCYASRAGALSAVRGVTGRASVRAAVEHIAAQNAMPEVSVSCAARGDMALYPRSRGRDFSLGIVAMNGQQLWVAMREGFAPAPLSNACRAWRV